MEVTEVATVVNSVAIIILGLAIIRMSRRRY